MTHSLMSNYLTKFLNQFSYTYIHVYIHVNDSSLMPTTYLHTYTYTPRAYVLNTCDDSCLPALMCSA